jgi:hypothetical protein
MKLSERDTILVYNMVLKNGGQFMFRSNAGSQRRTFHLIIASDGVIPLCDDQHGILVKEIINMRVQAALD